MFYLRFPSYADIGGGQIEHVHIMLYQAPPDLLERVTQGDRPISESWTGAAGQCAGD